MVSNFILSFWSTIPELLGDIYGFIYLQTSSWNVMVWSSDQTMPDSFFVSFTNTFWLWQFYSFIASDTLTACQLCSLVMSQQGYPE